MSILVIYSDLDNEVRKHFEAMGLEFVQEQHGSGPVHYSCEMNGVLMEIYPARNEAHPCDEVRFLSGERWKRGGGEKNG